MDRETGRQTQREALGERKQRGRGSEDNVSVTLATTLIPRVDLVWGLW